MMRQSVKRRERERERETMGLENPAKDGWPSSSSWSILAWSSSECSCFCCTDSSNCTVLLADIDIWISHTHTHFLSLCPCEVDSLSTQLSQSLFHVIGRDENKWLL